MADKPTKLPRWASGGTASVLEPSEAKKDIGFVKEKPPIQTDNWLQLTNYQWIDYLQEAVALLLGKSGRAFYNRKLAYSFDIPFYTGRLASIAVAAPTDVIVLGGFLFVTSIGGNTLEKIDITTDTIVDSTSSLGSSVDGLTTDGINLYALDKTGNNAHKVDPSDLSILGSVSLPSQPLSSFYVDGFLWVGDSANNVQKIDVSTMTISTAVAVGSFPLAMSYDGTHLWVVNQASNNVSKLNVTTNVVDATVVVANTPAGVDFDGVYIWVASVSGTISKIEIVTNTVINTIATAGSGVTFDGKFIYVSSGSINVYKININTDTIIDTTVLSGGAAPNLKELTYDGINIWIADTVNGLVHKIIAG